MRISLIEAKDQFEKAISKGMENADVYFMLGMSLSSSISRRFALPYFQRSVELNEEDIEAVSN